MVINEENKLQNWCDALIIVTKFIKIRSKTTTVWLFLSCYVSVVVLLVNILFLLRYESRDAYILIRSISISCLENNKCQGRWRMWGVAIRISWPVFLKNIFLFRTWKCKDDTYWPKTAIKGTSLYPVDKRTSKVHYRFNFDTDGRPGTSAGNHAHSVWTSHGHLLVLIRRLQNLVGLCLDVC